VSLRAERESLADLRASLADALSASMSVEDARVVAIVVESLVEAKFKELVARYAVRKM
jgi:hypothetical protein